jgi:hypothetical protein
MDVKEMECEAVDWIYATPDSVQWLDFVNTVMNLRVSLLKMGNIFTTWAVIGFSKRTLFHGSR